MTKENTKKNTADVRLSKDVTPTKYEIQLKPDLKNFTFEGLETIHLSFKKPTKTITLHSIEIEIETASVLIGKEKIFAHKISYDEKKERVTFSFSKTIPAGKGEITLVFKGILNDKMRGFYRSKYNIGSIEYNMATTQFESTDARRAFPCIDEPAHKAVFNVALIVPKGKTAISNTLPISKLEHEAGYEIVKFSPTPKMSTYLVAFIVGDFEYIESKTKRGVQVRVFTTPGKKHQAKFALSCAVKTLDFYEEYFDILYPLPILDMIAIPDFTTAAMENWGAVTYRESAILFDEQHSSIDNKQWVASVITHELAHQWFGNLVTMEWWTHLWLNEGFATYIGNFAQAEIYPKDDVWNQFVSASSGHGLGNALRLDALNSTHPVEVLVHHPDEIGEVFDIISYDKGASVIRMLAEYLGPEDFRDGLRYYLKKHSYKNTETVHLWQAFEKVSRKPVTKIMDNWISQPGYPVIKAEVQGKNLSLSQSRFFSSPISKAKTKDKTLWQIPVTVSTAKNKSKILLSKTQSTIPLPDSWLKLNMNETSFFRTAYSKELLAELIVPVQKKILSPADRLGIVRDLFVLSEAGVIPTTDALLFLLAYKNEDAHTVWVEIASGMGTLRQLLVKENVKEEFNQLTRVLFSPIVEKLGWTKKKNESSSDTMLRGLVLALVGRAGDKKIIAEAKKKFTEIKKGAHVDTDIHDTVYRIVTATGGIKDYESFIKLYKKETLHEAKNRIGDILGSFTDPKILKLVCEFSLSKDVRPQDAFFIFSYVGRNPVGRDVWFSFIKNNWKILIARYGDGTHILSSVVKAISGSAEAKHLKEYKAFFKTHDAPGAKRAIEQTMERMESNVAWLARDGKKIAEFLKNDK